MTTCLLEKLVFFNKLFSLKHAFVLLCNFQSRMCCLVLWSYAYSRLIAMTT
ncbi:hypothetical protein Plhal304r1_c012g0046821 [Plasmopara halstedii]